MPKGETVGNIVIDDNGDNKDRDRQWRHQRQNCYHSSRGKGRATEATKAEAEVELLF